MTIAATTPASKASKSAAFLEAVTARRSYYQLTNASPISDEALESIIKTAVNQAPSSFNTQSSRAVLVLGESNKKLWQDIVKPTYLAVVQDEASKANYDAKINGYAAGYGTVMIFEDDAVIEAMVARMPALGAVFPVFSSHSTGMLQYVIWTALEAEGFGANLQHYGAYAPTTNPAILEGFDLPKTWKNTALIPFGVPGGQPGEKTYLPIEDRFKSFN